MLLRDCLIIFIISLLVACSEVVPTKIKQLGEPQTRIRTVAQGDPLAHFFMDEVKPLLDKRCVVCHGCYDAPCQLKLSSPEGIDRGFSPQVIYATRLLETAPTRLFIDEQDTQAWRERGYRPVLNERDQTAEANLDGSVLYQLLAQKKEQPLPDVTILPESFDFSLNREQQCPSIETFHQYKEDYPLAGMPYGLPALNNDEHLVLQKWLSMGAPMAQPIDLSSSIIERINQWETRLNGSDDKSQLISRYIYEHLFLGKLYFSELPYPKGKTPVYFRLVRSKTPPGEMIQEIATRRPYEDPKVDRVYYRLWQDTGTVLTKTHMPYALNKQRMERWNELFFESPFTVDALPGYSKDNNPFVVFNSLPAHSRYQFMLDEAQFTIMGFIKGPVCRGQTALNLIQDDFWVFFKDPDYLKMQEFNDFIFEQADNLELPSDYSTRNLISRTWYKYSNKEKNFMKAQKKFVTNRVDLEKIVGVDATWKGNENAALTVFRNFDSAVVLKGLQGSAPKTAWVISYPILERIHYLLVAGYDVYGSVRHQLITRLYMDFLRIEGETYFLALLPEDLRKPELDSWYLDASDKMVKLLSNSDLFSSQKNSIKYTTDNPKEELFERLKARHYDSLSESSKQRTLLNVEKGELAELNKLPNIAVQQLSQNSVLIVKDEQENSLLFSLVRHNEHKNVSSLLNEEKMRQPELDKAQIFRGVLGSYPQTVFKINSAQAAQFVTQFKAINDLASYQKLLDEYGIRRTHPDFWQVSDRLHQLHYLDDPITYGLLDYNRLENR
jgi:hypothetical protein